MVPEESVNDPAAFQASVEEVQDQDFVQPADGVYHVDAQRDSDAQENEGHCSEPYTSESNQHEHPGVAWFGTTERATVNHRCKTCGQSFPSGNKLHAHVRNSHPKTATAFHIDDNQTLSKKDKRPRY